MTLRNPSLPILPDLIAHPVAACRFPACLREGYADENAFIDWPFVRIVASVDRFARVVGKPTSRRAGAEPVENHHRGSGQRPHEHDAYPSGQS